MLAYGQGAAVVGEAARRDGRPGSSCGWRSRQAGRSAGAQLWLARPLGGGTAGAAPDTPDCQGRRTPRTAKDDGQPGTAKDDGQPGLPRATDSWGRYPLQDLGETVVSIISAARGLRPK